MPQDTGKRLFDETDDMKSLPSLLSTHAFPTNRNQYILAAIETIRGVDNRLPLKVYWIQALEA